MASLASFTPRLGMRVQVVGKGTIGVISYIGMTGFAPGKWIGVTLDEALGKNDGTVQGRRYFDCPPQHGVFLRQTQLEECPDTPAVQVPSTPSVALEPAAFSDASGDDTGADLQVPSSTPNRGLPKLSGLRRPGFTSASSEKTVEEPQDEIPVPVVSDVSSRKETVASLGSSIVSPAAKGRLPSPGSGLRKPGQSRPSSSAGTQKTPTPPPSIGVSRSNSSQSIAGQQAVTSGATDIEEPGSVPVPTAAPAQKDEVIIPTPPVAHYKPYPTPVSGDLPTAVAVNASSSMHHVRKQPSLEQASFLQSEQAQEFKVESPPPVHRTVAVAEELLEVQRKLTEQEKIASDLAEKLNVIKQKRLNDQSKLKEVEKLRMQNQQLLEYKTKWQETYRELQNQLRQAQKEAQEAAQQAGSNTSEVAELHEAVEMATLDKEMAEEKYESLMSEHENLKEKLEEVSLELEILKSEINEGGVESAAESALAKQMEQQNLRLKEAIVKMRELAQQDKALIADLQKANKERDNQLSLSHSECDKLRERLSATEAQVDDLKEQVDVALGAEEMVEQLTDRNLELEDKIEQLEEAVQDLESLRELNQELEENHVQTEHELRESLDMKENKVRELERQLTAQLEQVGDYQETILKFRELVANLQVKIKELQEKPDSNAGPFETVLDSSLEIDFKSKFEEKKQYGRIIELELNKYEVTEANKKVQMINSYLPDQFLKRGGDFDGICMLLLLERMAFKCNMLSNQLHEKYDILNIVEKGQPIAGVKGDQASYAALLSYDLANMQRVIRQYLRAANSCDVATYTRVAGQYPELAAHEKVIDNYIELLCKDLLDDTISLEVLEKTVQIIKNFYQLHLANAHRQCADFLADSLLMFTCGGECVSVDVQRMKSLAGNCEEGSSFLNLISFLELKNMEVKQFSRKIKRRMIQEDNLTLSYPESVSQDLMAQLDSQNLIVRYCSDLAGILASKSSSLAEGEKLLSGHMDEAAQDCVTMVFEVEDDPMVVLSATYQRVLLCMSGIAIKLTEGEYDTEPESKPNPPYLGRATAFKEELSSTAKLEEKIEQRDQEVVAYKKALKVKADELSQANIRIGLLEKRADNAAREADVKVDQISKKLDALQAEYAEKTKQYEVSLDHLQCDIDGLENEKAEMKKRLDAYSKKSLLTDLARHASSPAAAMAGLISPGKPGSAMSALAKAGVAGASPPMQVVLNDSPIFLAQLESQKKALQFLKAENTKLKSRSLKADLNDLPKPYVPKLMWKDGDFHAIRPAAERSSEDRLSASSVMKDCKSLHKNLLELAVFPKVVDISKKTHEDGKFIPAPAEQLAQQVNILSKLEKQKNELSQRVLTSIARELPGASVSSSLRNFISPEYTRMHEEKLSPVIIGRIHFPLFDKSAKPGTRRVSLTPLEFRHVHLLMTAS